MTFAPLRRLPAFVLASAVLAAGLTGCGGDGLDVASPEFTDCDATPGELAMVLGARANSPAPVLPSMADQVLRQAAEAEETITVFRLDGAPAKAFDATFASSAGNDRALERDYNAFMSDMYGLIGEVRSEAPEADLLGALDLAGRTVGEGGTIVVVDSGLQTVDPLDFSTDGLLAADPAEVVEFLTDTDHLPDLQDRTVVLAGVGDTAEPQEALTTPWRNNLIAIWTAVAEAAGACVEVEPDPLGDAPVADDLEAVTTVPIPEAETAVVPCGQTILDNTGPVRFQPDSDQFIDRDAAREALGEIAELMIAENQHAELIGTTALSGSEEGRLALSELRAEAVKDELVDLGVPADRITTRGVGAEWPHRLDDLGPDGELLPGPAARNRAVVVELSCPE